jgi:hypothetical protein
MKRQITVMILSSLNIGLRDSFLYLFVIKQRTIFCTFNNNNAQRTMNIKIT